MDRATLSTNLQGLGLSETDSAIYLAALDRDRDDASVETIAAETGHPTATVDDAIGRLETRGFVTVDGETIDARPLGAVLEDLRTSLETLETFAEGTDERGQGRTDARPRDRSRPQSPFDVVDTEATLRDRLVDLIEGATEEVALSIPASLLEDLEDELREAVERDVLVALLVCSDESLATERFDGIASVVRVWSRDAPILVIADYHRGLSAPSALLEDPSAGEPGITFDHREQSFVLKGSFFGNYWRIATQLYTTEPDPLPRTYTNIRHAVFQATLRLDAGDDVRVSADARPVGVEEFDTVEGRLVDVRQSLLEPVHESFAIENGLIVDRTDDGLDGERVTLGGEGAFVEEFKTRSVTLSLLE